MNLIPQAVERAGMRLLVPLVNLLLRLRVRPNTITTAGTLLVVASAAAFAVGRAHWGGVLLLVSGIFDLLDGRVARDGGARTTFGAFYDSTLDRVGESALFTGIALYFPQGGVAHDRITLAVVVSCIALGASLIVSYTRARAEGLGLECNVGIMRRAERILLLGAPTMFFGAGTHGMLLFWIVVVLAATTVITVIQRMVHVARLAPGSGVVRAVRPPPRDTLAGRAPALQARKGH